MRAPRSRFDGVTTGSDVFPSGVTFPLGPDGASVALVVTPAGYALNGTSQLLHIPNPTNVELLFTRVGSSWTEVELLRKNFMYF